MRLACLECGKSVTNEIYQTDVIARAVIHCPECWEKLSKAAPWKILALIDQRGGALVRELSGFPCVPQPGDAVWTGVDENFLEVERRTFDEEERAVVLWLEGDLDESMVEVFLKSGWSREA